MKKILVFLLILPTFCSAQSISESALWKGYPVQDTTGKEIRDKRQDFIKVVADTLFMLQFQELMSMQTGEVKIETVIDTLIILPTKLKKTYNLSGKDETIRLELKGDTEFQLHYPKFILTFKKMTDLKVSPATLAEFEEYIEGSTFIEIDPVSQKENGTLTKSYQANGKVIYQEINSTSNWESAFILVEFGDFVFLKGISSATIILSEIENNTLVGIEADYRFQPKAIGFKKLDD